MGASERARGMGAIVAAVLGTVSAIANAQSTALEVRTLEYPSWPAAVAALQTRLNSAGTTLHVVVRESASQRRLACGEYTLQLDAVSATAFSVGACNPSTSATEVRLLDRDKLFDTGDVVPRPRMAAITATQVRVGASRGGAQATGGSQLRCSVAVRPYLRDLLHGTVVYLTPGRFTLRLVVANIHVEAGATAWTLRSSASTTVEYEVLDTQRNGEVVVHDRASIRCTEESIALPVDSNPRPAVPVERRQSP